MADSTLISSRWRRRDGHLTDEALELLQLVEVPETEAAAMRTYLGTCLECARREEALRAASASRLPLTPTRMAPPKSPRRASTYAGGFALAAALVLGVWWFALPVGNDAPECWGAPEVVDLLAWQEPVDERTKGGLVLELYVHDGAKVRRAVEGEPVRPGDRFGMRLVTRVPGYVAVVGLDERNETYPCFPTAPGAEAEPVRNTPARIEPDHAMRLDDAPGRETIVALRCDRPFAVDEARRVLREEGEEGLESSAFARQHGCDATSVSLHKVVEVPP